MEKGKRPADIIMTPAWHQPGHDRPGHASPRHYGVLELAWTRELDVQVSVNQKRAVPPSNGRQRRISDDLAWRPGRARARVAGSAQRGREGAEGTSRSVSSPWSWGA
jgi:hypothetical protein